jgi:outer membrane immunogenic protein
MKKLIAGAVVVAALFSAPAFAADMPVKAEPLFNWTGWYLGGNGGYSWGRSRTTINTTAATTTQSIRHDGWEGSGEGGYCYQTPGAATVTCIELRYDFPRERGRTTDFPGILVTTQPVVDPFLVGPHFGYLTDANHMMWYLAGGLAVGEVGGSATAAFNGSGSASKWTAGWFVGAGIERMVDQHWSWKLEYDYVSFSGSNGATALTITDPRLLPVGSTIAVGGHAYDNVVTVGINYHFGTH